MGHPAAGGGADGACVELCGGSGFEALPVLDQLVEDGAVLDHRGAEFFGGCVNAVGANGDAMGEAIVFHDARVVNGNIVSALVEARTWISASLKERIDKVVGIGDGGLGMIDEAGLDGVPLGDKALTLGDAEIADYQGLNP